MCADLQSLAKVFRKRANVSSGRTRDSHFEIEGAVEIVFQQFTARLDGLKTMNANPHRFSFHLFTAAREFVKLLAALLLGGKHRRHLIDVATQALKRRFDFVPAPTGCLEITRKRFSGYIARVGSVAQANDRLGFLFDSAEKLRQARGAADENHQHASGKRIERSGVTNSAHSKDRKSTRLNS